MRPRQRRRLLPLPSKEPCCEILAAAAAQEGELLLIGRAGESDLNGPYWHGDWIELISFENRMGGAALTCCSKALPL